MILEPSTYPELHYQPKQGKLKIFFGYAAGVGKTYAMLKSAHRAKQQGLDVVVGYIERHGKNEYEDLFRLKKRNQPAGAESGLLEPYEPIDPRAMRATEPNHAGAVHFVHQSRFEHGVPTWRFGETVIEQSDAASARRPALCDGFGSSEERIERATEWGDGVMAEW